MRLPILESSTTSVRHFDTGPASISAVRMLRISVTDRCNFRCLYCMPAEGVEWLPKDEILSFEEIETVVRSAIEQYGIRRFKLTGGEPTVRHGIVDLVYRLARIDGIEDLSLTTNGFRLIELAEPLKQAGLHRVTVSIDSLKADRFRQITRTGDLATVLRGLDMAEEVGFDGLKINCVTMRGVNDDELADFARLSLSRRLTVRFIEYMPLGDSALLSLPQAAGRDENQLPLHKGEDWGEGHHATPRISAEEIGPAGGCGAQARGNVFISETEVRRQIENELGALVAVSRHTEPGVGPANVYRLEQGHPKGRVGFISAMSAPFCSSCNRLRLTATGVLRSCLFEGGEVHIRSILRGVLEPSARLAAISQAMADCVRLKPQVHSHRGNEQMSRIGG
jgi:GTP 3',8-cyclase